MKGSFMTEVILGTIAILFMHLYITKMYINRLLYIWYDSVYLLKESIVRTIINTLLGAIAIFIPLKYIPYWHHDNIFIRITIIVIVLIGIVWYYRKEKKDLTINKVK